MTDLSRFFADLCAGLVGDTAGPFPGLDPEFPGENTPTGNSQAFDTNEISRISRISRSENTQTISDDTAATRFADFSDQRVARTSSYEKTPGTPGRPGNGGKTLAGTTASYFPVKEREPGTSGKWNWLVRALFPSPKPRRSATRRLVDRQPHDGLGATARTCCACRRAAPDPCGRGSRLRRARAARSGRPRPHRGCRSAGRHRNNPSQGQERPGPSGAPTEQLAMSYLLRGTPRQISGRLGTDRKARDEAVSACVMSRRAYPTEGGPRRKDHGGSRVWRRRRKAVG